MAGQTHNPDCGEGRSESSAHVPTGGPLAHSFRCCGLPPRQSESSDSTQDLGLAGVGGTSAPAGFKITCPQWAFRSGPSSWGMPTAPWPGPKTSVTQSWLPPLYSRRPCTPGIHPRRMVFILHTRKNAVWVRDPKYLEVLPTHSCSWSRPPSSYSLGKQALWLRFHKARWPSAGMGGILFTCARMAWVRPAEGPQPVRCCLRETPRKGLALWKKAYVPGAAEERACREEVGSSSGTGQERGCGVGRGVCPSVLPAG